ncbi:MAG: magnesium transporter [Gemmatimonadales bacterium]
MSEQLVSEMRRLAAAGDVPSFLRYAHQVHPSDLSDALVELDPDLQRRLIHLLPADVVSEALAEMEEGEHPAELLASLKPEQAADIVEELDDDDAADLIGDLPLETARRLLAAVANRADLEQLLRYDEETAGGRMTRLVVSVRDDATIAEALTSIRQQAEAVDDFYQVYVVDAAGTLKGLLPIQRLVTAGPERRVADVAEPVIAQVTPDVDQEEVARLMARYNVAAIPVVDPLGRLIGRVTFDDVIDVVEAEGTEDLLLFGGTAPDEQLEARWTAAVGSRLPWLFVNTVTAFLAATLVYLFQDAIGALVLLAVFMPIVAGQGGNAGTQALAVTVRRLALNLIPKGRGWRVVGKEVLVGLVNGLAVGLVVGVVAAIAGGTWHLGLVVVLAMWGNLIIAGLVGSAVPILLHRVGADPAVGSSVFVTPVTDACGFLLLLGLASWILL